MHKEDAIFLVTNSGREIISFGALLAPEGTDIQHKVKIGGASFTDGRIMETGLPEYMINDEEDEFNPTFTRQHGKYALKAVTAHEYGHIWFTNFNVFRKFQEEMIEVFEKDGINPRLASKIASHFFNITEDGRIEKRMVNLYPGLINYFRFNNGTVWQSEKDEVPEDELSAFLRVMVTYVVVGIKPKWYKRTKGTRMRAEFEKIEDMLDDCVNAPTCKENARLTRKVMEEVWDYLLELLQKAQEDMEQMEELLELLGDIDFQEGCSGAGDETSAGEGSRSARISVSSSGQEGEEEGESELSGAGSEEGKEGEEDDEESGAAKREAGEEEKEALELEEIDTPGDNSGKAGSSKGKTTKNVKYKDISEMSTEMPGYDYSEITGDGGGSKKVKRSKKGVVKGPERLVEEIVKTAEEEVSKDVFETKTSPKKNETSVSTISREEVSKIVTDVGYDKEHVRYFREERETYRMIPIAEEYRAAATKFKRKIQRCFNERNTLMNNMNSGRLNTNDLYRLGLKEYNVFQKKLNRSDTDAVVEICWDGSGSMYGGKQKWSGVAVSIIEEGLKSLVPLKIINYTVDWSAGEVVHYLVKDFDEKDSKINYAMSYAKSKGFSGGNKDGYDIRICTEDLLRRPEKDKILIVMSDGLPSDYNSINPQDDVKDAVKSARRKGIVVIPIFFGDESFRERALPDYEYMYEKHIINSSPEELPERLVKLLEKLIMR